jgi:hypothetical protein
MFYSKFFYDIIIVYNIQVIVLIIRAIASKFGMIFDSKQINGLQIPLKK